MRHIVPIVLTVLAVAVSVCLAQEAAPPSVTAVPESAAKVELTTQMEQLRAAARAGELDKIVALTSGWVLPDAEERFKRAWPERGVEPVAGYAEWVKQYAGQAKSPLVGALRVQQYETLVVELGVDRPAREGLEAELVKAFGKDSPVLSVHLFSMHYGWPMTWFPNLYFIRTDAGLRCLSGAGFLVFARPGFPLPTVGEDPAADQKPTLESFTRMIVALDVACKRSDYKRVKHLTSRWRIPDEEKFYREHWGEEEGAKIAKGYATCANKYTNYEKSEMGSRFWQGFQPEVVVMAPDGNMNWFLRACVDATKRESPVFIVKLMDPNGGRQGWGDIPFLYMDGAFRMIGMPEYVPIPRPKR